MYVEIILKSVEVNLNVVITVCYIFAYDNPECIKRLYSIVEHSILSFPAFQPVFTTEKTICI